MSPIRVHGVCDQHRRYHEHGGDINQREYLDESHNNKRTEIGKWPSPDIREAVAHADSLMFLRDN